MSSNQDSKHPETEDVQAGVIRAIFVARERRLGGAGNRDEGERRRGKTAAAPEQGAGDSTASQKSPHPGSDATDCQ